MSTEPEARTVRVEAPVGLTALDEACYGSEAAERELEALRDEIERLRALEAACREVLYVAGPEMWQNSTYFRAADKCNRLMTPNDAHQPTAALAAGRLDADVGLEKP